MRAELPLAVAIGAALAVSACSKKSEEAQGDAIAAKSELPKREPGSWTNTIDVVALEGKNVPADAKQQMQAMFDMMGSMSVCVTPEMAAQEDVAEKIAKMGNEGADCTMERNASGDNRIDFVALCKSDGQTVRMSGAGDVTPTSQDITMKIQPANPDEGRMEMRIQAKRNGDCTDKDVTPPAG